jgi:type I restriction enzyme R subunit
MVAALNNLNADLTKQYTDYVCRVTSAAGDTGKSQLYKFKDVLTQTPAIAVTSRLLTTGVDIPTCKNVVLARVIRSMTDFKQIVGRGTRVDEDNGKLFFNILDSKPVTTAQRLGSVIKSARDIMRKDKRMNGELDRLFAPIYLDSISQAIR